MTISLPALIHVTHQKSGSQWVRRILEVYAPERIVTPQIDNRQFLAEPVQEGYIYPTVYVTWEEFEKVKLPSHWRRFVVIRDLRDACISAYFSIRYSHRPNPYVKQWRETLSKMSQEEGILWVFHNWLPSIAEIQRSWLASNERLFRYEEMLENDYETFLEIFRHCNYPVDEEKLRHAVVSQRFENITGGAPAGPDGRDGA